jgi:hypothetical protein
MAASEDASVDHFVSEEIDRLIGGGKRMNVQVREFYATLWLLLIVIAFFVLPFAWMGYEIRANLQ